MNWMGSRWQTERPSMCMRLRSRNFPSSFTSAAILGQISSLFVPLVAPQSMHHRDAMPSADECFKRVLQNGIRRIWCGPHSSCMQESTLGIKTNNLVNPSTRILDCIVLAHASSKSRPCEPHVRRAVFSLSIGQSRWRIFNLNLL